DGSSYFYQIVGETPLNPPHNKIFITGWSAAGQIREISRNIYTDNTFTTQTVWDIFAGTDAQHGRAVWKWGADLAPGPATPNLFEITNSNVEFGNGPTDTGGVFHSTPTEFQNTVTYVDGVDLFYDVRNMPRAMLFFVALSGTPLATSVAGAEAV